MTLQKRKQKQQKRKPYSTDLTDKQWNIIKPLLPPPKKEGHPREVDIREIMNAIIYVVKSGCDWRMLPHDFPKWQLVYYYFRTWKKDGAWKHVHDTLRGKVRKKAGKKEQPTAGIVDSQSVKTTEKGGFVAMTLVKK